MKKPATCLPLKLKSVHTIRAVSVFFLVFCTNVFLTACTAHRPAAPSAHIPARQSSGGHAFSSLPPDLSEHRKTILYHTLQSLGTPYAWGGRHPDQGFDCSGLVSYVYASAGISLPRTASALLKGGIPMPKAFLEPGDLVFFSNTKKKTNLHVGIFIGSGQFVHAPGRGRTVSASSLNNIYFQEHFIGARSYITRQ